MKTRVSFSVTLIIAVMLLSSIAYPDEPSNLSHKFSLKLTGGMRFITVGDISTSFEGWARTLPSRSYDDVAKAMNIDRWSAAWEVELRLDLSKNIALGISMSNPLRRAKQANFALYDLFSTDDIPIGSFTSDAVIYVRAPIKISVYYIRSISPNTNLLLHMGTGYYSGRMQEALDCEYSDKWHRSTWQTEWSSALGFHGGLGIEYMFSKRLSFVLDAQLRRVILTNFAATMDLDSNMVPSGFYFDESGTLYLAHWDEDGPFGPGTQEFYVWSTEPKGPVGGMFGAASRGKARLDLSGFSILIGLKISVY